MTAPTPEQDALKRAVLDTFVPQNTESSVSEILSELDGDEDSDRPSLLQVKQRSLLFFGKLSIALEISALDKTHSAFYR
jgi:hypothetical protein